MLEKKDGKLKIHILPFFLKFIKNIRLSEYCTSYPIIENDLSLFKKHDYLGKNDFDLLDYLRYPTSDCYFETNFICDPLYDTPPWFDEYADELFYYSNDLSPDILDTSRGLCQIVDPFLEKKLSFV